MKQSFNYCIIALLLSAFTSVANGQQVYRGQIDIKEVEMTRVGDSLQVKMQIDLKKIKLSRNRYLTLTPQVTDDKNSVELEDVLINGSNRSRSYNRSISLDKKQLEEYQPQIVAKSKSKDKLHFSQTIAFEKWMQNAHLNMKEVLCGCGGNSEEVAETRLLAEPPLPLVYDVKPQYAYLQPQAETTKARGDQFELYLNFPVNKTNIQPNYMNNASELSQLKAELDKIRADKYLDIQKINIIGYASPEGTIAHNESLSKDRAEELKKHLVAKLDYPASVYSVAYGGENWDGLVDAVDKSYLSDKTEILSILRNTSDANSRKSKLKAFKKGVPYKNMLTNIYPKLRKVVLDVQYNVENFSIEDAKEVMKTRPHLLSPAEIYAVANTYPQGSAEYISAMETAARVFPKDETANLNAATIALSKNDTSLAESYMKKVNSGSAEYANNMGLLHLLKGDLVQAKNEFEKASQKGLPAGKHNLEEVIKKGKVEFLRK